MLTEKDINIFTIVKDKNNISPLRQWCIDSWKKCMPNANIMIFADNDLNNPNWKYYDVIKNDRLWNYYKNRTQFPSKSDSISPISTDSIRIRLLKAIPNALYMDSDAYLNITSKELLKLFNDHYDTDILIEQIHFNPDVSKTAHSFAFTGYFAGGKNKLLDAGITCYNNISARDVFDDATMTLKYYNHSYHNLPYVNVSSSDGHHLQYHIALSHMNRIIDNNRNMINTYIDTVNVVILKCQYLSKYHSLDDVIDYMFFKYNKCNDNNYYLIIVDGDICRHFDYWNWTCDTKAHRINKCNNSYYNLTRIVGIRYFSSTQYQEFIAKLKETINNHFKSPLEINYYELEDPGDNSPCLLKKI